MGVDIATGSVCGWGANGSAAPHRAQVEAELAVRPRQLGHVRNPAEDFGVFGEIRTAQISAGTNSKREKTHHPMNERCFDFAMKAGTKESNTSRTRPTIATAKRHPTEYAAL